MFGFTVVRRRRHFDFCLLRVVHGRRGYGCRARAVRVQRLVVRWNVIAVRGNRWVLRLLALVVIVVTIVWVVWPNSRKTPAGPLKPKTKSFSFFPVYVTFGEGVIIYQLRSKNWLSSNRCTCCRPQNLHCCNFLSCSRCDFCGGEKN